MHSCSGIVGFEAVRVGDKLPDFQAPEITRTMLALYAGGSGDHNRVHIDSDYAQAAGFTDVFANGMLAMALLGRFLCTYTEAASVREFTCRFTAVTPVNAQLRCSGEVIEKFHFRGEKRVKVKMRASTADGATKVEGQATIACR